MPRPPNRRHNSIDCSTAEGMSVFKRVVGVGNGVVEGFPNTRASLDAGQYSFVRTNYIDRYS